MTHGQQKTHVGDIWLTVKIIGENNKKTFTEFRAKYHRSPENHHPWTLLLQSYLAVTLPPFFDPSLKVFHVLDPMNWEIHAALRFFSRAFKNGDANPLNKLHHFNHKPPIIQSYMGPHIPGLYHWMVTIYQSSTHHLPPFTQIRAAHAPAIHPLVHLNGAKWAKHGAIALQLQRLRYITAYCISINIYI